MDSNTHHHWMQPGFSYRFCTFTSMFLAQFSSNNINDPFLIACDNSVKRTTPFCGVTAKKHNHTSSVRECGIHMWSFETNLSLKNLSQLPFVICKLIAISIKTFWQISSVASWRINKIPFWPSRNWSTSQPFWNS